MKTFALSLLAATALAFTEEEANAQGFIRWLDHEEVDCWVGIAAAEGAVAVGLFTTDNAEAARRILEGEEEEAAEEGDAEEGGDEEAAAEGPYLWAYTWIAIGRAAGQEGKKLEDLEDYEEVEGDLVTGGWFGFAMTEETFEEAGDQFCGQHKDGAWEETTGDECGWIGAQALTEDGWGGIAARSLADSEPVLVEAEDYLWITGIEWEHWDGEAAEPTHERWGTGLTTFTLGTPLTESDAPEATKEARRGQGNDPANVSEEEAAAVAEEAGDGAAYLAAGSLLAAIALF